MKVALYIPCFNAEKTIRACLKAVFSQERPADEVLVIDDGSTDQTVNFAREYPVKIIRHTGNLGLAASRNTAINNTTAKLISSLDSDCKPNKSWLKYLVERMASSKPAGVGGKTEESESPSIIDNWRAVHMKQHWGDNAQNDPPFLFGSNTLFRRDLLLEAGAYNEKYRNNFEDVDISNRLRKKGYRLFYEPRAVVRHLRKDNLSSLLNNFWKWNLAYYLKRGFYGSPERFVFKIKDNIGLSNRFLEEDLAGKRYGLLYLDFLIALHHSLRDFDYFSFQGKRRDFYISPGSKVSAWLSLLDLVFFYHFDQSKAGFATLMPKENMFRQNLFALSLVLSIFTKTKFNDQRFNSILYKHLFYSVHEIRDKQLLERLNTLTELRPDWNGFIKKEHPYIDKRFLDVLLSSFREWVDILIYRFPNIIGLIKKSARQAEAAMAAA